MGRPLAESRAEVEKCASACDYCAEHAAGFLADESVVTSADRSWIGYEPVGVVLAVLPWNFPLWQVIRFAAPALMAGNAALLKHSPNTTGCALAVQDLLAAAGAPDGLFAALVVAEPRSRLGEGCHHAGPSTANRRATAPTRASAPAVAHRTPAAPTPAATRPTALGMST